MNQASLISFNREVKFNQQGLKIFVAHGQRFLKLRLILIPQNYLSKFKRRPLFNLIPRR